MVGDGERMVAQPQVLDAGLDVRLAKQRLDVRREQVGHLEPRARAADGLLREVGRRVEDAREGAEGHHCVGRRAARGDVEEGHDEPLPPSWPAIVTTASERGSVRSAAWGSVAAPTAFLIAANGLRSGAGSRSPSILPPGEEDRLEVGEAEQRRPRILPVVHRRPKRQQRHLVAVVWSLRRARARRSYPPPVALQKGSGSWYAPRGGLSTQWSAGSTVAGALAASAAPRRWAPVRGRIAPASAAGTRWRAR